MSKRNGVHPERVRARARVAGKDGLWAKAPDKQVRDAIADLADFLESENGVTKPGFPEAVMREVRALWFPDEMEGMERYFRSEGELAAKAINDLYRLRWRNTSPRGLQPNTDLWENHRDCGKSLEAVVDTLRMLIERDYGEELAKARREAKSL